MFDRPLRQADSVADAYLLVLADDVNCVAALGAVVLNALLAAYLVKWRTDLPLLLCLTCADLLAGSVLTLQLFGDWFCARSTPGLVAAGQVLWLAAATASLLSVAAIAAGSRCRGPGSRRKHHFLVAGVWLGAATIGPVTVLSGPGDWAPSSECSPTSMVHPTQFVLWLCLTHLFVAVVVAAHCGRKRSGVAVDGQKDEDLDVEEASIPVEIADPEMGASAVVGRKNEDLDAEDASIPAKIVDPGMEPPVAVGRKDEELDVEEASIPVEIADPEMGASAVVSRKDEDLDVEEASDLELGPAVVAAVCYGLCWTPFVVMCVLRWTALQGSGCWSGLLQLLFFGVGAANYALKPSLYAWRVLWTQAITPTDCSVIR